jgi:tetratricopeptide (TPR) repeat protein
MRAILALLRQLRGAVTGNQRNVAGFKQAIDYFQQATTKDPSYARAYAGLADCYALLGGYSELSQPDFMPKARTAARRAVELDGNLPEAHTALALIVQNYDWDWQTAENEFRRAIELNPNYATAHHWYAEHLTWLGRFDEALSESERARQLDPLSLIIAADNGATLYYSRQYDQAIAKFLAVREMDPNFARTGVIRSAYEQKGLFGNALEEIEKWRRAYGDQPWTWSELTYVYGRSGQQAQANMRSRNCCNGTSENQLIPRLLSGRSWNRQQGPGVCLSRKSIFATFDHSRHFEGRARLRPATQ